MKKNILNIFYLKIKKNKIVMIEFEPMTSTLLEWCSNPTELQYLIFNLRAYRDLNSDLWIQSPMC